MRNEKSLQIRGSRSEFCCHFGRVCFSVIFVLIALMVSAQDKTVSGTVIDETGEPVIGATVMVKGSKVGIATDIDGKYTLNTPPQCFNY